MAFPKNELSRIIVNNPGGGDCGFYAFFIGALPILKAGINGSENEKLIWEEFQNKIQATPDNVLTQNEKLEFINNIKSVDLAQINDLPNREFLKQANKFLREALVHSLKTELLKYRINVKNNPRTREPRVVANITELEFHHINPESDILAPGGEFEKSVEKFLLNYRTKREQSILNIKTQLNNHKATQKQRSTILFKLFNVVDFSDEIATESKFQQWLRSSNKSLNQAQINEAMKYFKEYHDSSVLYASKRTAALKAYGKYGDKDVSLTKTGRIKYFEHSKNEKPDDCTASFTVEERAFINDYALKQCHLRILNSERNKAIESGFDDGFIEKTAKDLEDGNFTHIPDIENINFDPYFKYKQQETTWAIGDDLIRLGEIFGIKIYADEKTIINVINNEPYMVVRNQSNVHWVTCIEKELPKLTVQEIINEFKNYAEGDLFINQLLFPFLSRKHVALANEIKNALTNDMAVERALHVIVEKICIYQSEQGKNFDSKSLFAFTVNNIFTSYGTNINKELKKLKKQQVDIATMIASPAPIENNNSAQVSEQSVTQFLLLTGYNYLCYLTAGIAEPVIDYFTGNSNKEKDLQSQKEKDLQNQKETALSTIMKSSSYDELLDNIKNAKNNPIFKNKKASFEDLEMKMNSLFMLANIDNTDPIAIKNVTKEYIINCLDPNNPTEIKVLTATYKQNVANILVSLKPETRVAWAAFIAGIIGWAFGCVFGNARDYEYSASSLLESFVIKCREDSNQKINGPLIDALIDDFEDNADDIATSVAAIRPSA